MASILFCKDNLGVKVLYWTLWGRRSTWARRGKTQHYARNGPWSSPNFQLRSQLSFWRFPTKIISHIIHNFLIMIKHSAKWVPKCLNAGKMYIRVSTINTTLERFSGWEADFTSRLVIKLIILFHRYDLQTKPHWIEWHPSSLSCPKKFPNVIWNDSGFSVLEKNSG